MTVIMNFQNGCHVQKKLFDISASMSLMLQCSCVHKHFQGQRMNMLFRKTEYEHENMHMTN